VARRFILDRYLILDFLGPFLLAVGGFVIVGLVDILFTLVDLFVNSGVEGSVVFRLLIYKIPAIMVLFFPMAVLFSMMLLLVRMAKDNELTVLRSSGVSFFRIVRPLLLITIIVVFLCFFINETIVPWTNHVSDRLIKTAVKKVPAPDIAENVFFKDDVNRFFYINKLDIQANVMKDILVYEIIGDFPRIISAQKATWNQQRWVLFDGMIYEFNKEGKAEFTSGFARLNLNLKRDVRSFYSNTKTPREMSSGELKKKIDVLAIGGRGTRALQVEYYMKKSIPAASFIFAIIGIAYCFLFVKSGKDWWGVVLAICLAVLSVGFWFFLVALFRSLGRGDMLHPFWAAWLPNIFYFILGSIIILYKSLFN